jgi:hypothetical protein
MQTAALRDRIRALEDELQTRGADKTKVAVLQEIGAVSNQETLQLQRTLLEKNAEIERLSNLTAQVTDLQEIGEETNNDVFELQTVLLGKVCFTCVHPYWHALNEWAV